MDNTITITLEHKAFEIRKKMLDVCCEARTGHVTSCLSCADIMTTLFYGNIMKFKPEDPNWIDRDWFILSKGHASPLYYTILSDLGYFPERELNLFAQKDGIFGVHLQNSVPGVELTSGSLGQGLGVAAGISYGFKLNRQRNMVFTLIGDGECYEGSIWETAMFASHHKLNNLIAILDRNHMCVTDFTENLISMSPMEDKWKSFGWEIIKIDGHNIKQLLQAFDKIKTRKNNKPLIVIAETIKGKGIEEISNIPLWHGKSPIGEEEINICKESLQRSKPL